MEACSFSSNVFAAASLGAPGVSFLRAHVFFKGANALSVGFFLLRKCRLLNKQENVLLLALGTGFKGYFGKVFGIEQVARVVFGTLSIVRCSQDLIELDRLSNRLYRLITFKEYVLLKQDSLENRYRWAAKLRARQAEISKVIQEIFYQLIELACHTSDVYVAYQENTVSEVFIHGKDLFCMLTNDQSMLAKYFEQNGKINELMLNEFQMNAMRQVLKIQKTIPGWWDVFYEKREAFADYIVTHSPSWIWKDFDPKRFVDSPAGK